MSKTVKKSKAQKSEHRIRSLNGLLEPALPLPKYQDNTMTPLPLGLAAGLPAPFNNLSQPFQEMSARTQVAVKTADRSLVNDPRDGSSTRRCLAACLKLDFPVLLNTGDNLIRFTAGAALDEHSLAMDNDSLDYSVIKVFKEDIYRLEFIGKITPTTETVSSVLRTEFQCTCFSPAMAEFNSDLHDIDSSSVPIHVVSMCPIDSNSILKMNLNINNAGYQLNAGARWIITQIR